MSLIWHDAFYKFVALEDADKMAEHFRDFFAEVNSNMGELFGSIIVSEEGINGMLAGEEHLLDTFRETINNDPRFTKPDGSSYFLDMDYKRSASSHQPFGKIKVKRKREIVPLGLPDVSAIGRTGINVPPEEWRKLIYEDDVVLIDNRNDFEVRLGKFKGALNPKVDNFRDFPEYMLEHLEEWKDKRIAMYCTGGIRCEKTTSWLLDLGIETYQLEGGILKFFEDMPDAEKDWEGECFVFDSRVSLDCNMQETETTLEDVYTKTSDGEKFRLRRAIELRPEDFPKQ